MISPLQDSGGGQGHRHQVDQCRQLHQGAAGGDLGLDDEHRLGAVRTKTRPRNSSAPRCAACATTAMPTIAGRTVTEVTQYPDEIFEREGPALIDRIEWGATDPQGAHRSRRASGHSGDVPQGEAGARQGRRSAHRSCGLDRRGCGESRAVRARARRRREGLPVGSFLFLLGLCGRRLTKSTTAQRR